MEYFQSVLYFQMKMSDHWIFHLSRHQKIGLTVNKGGIVKSIMDTYIIIFYTCISDYSQILYVSLYFYIETFLHRHAYNGVLQSGVSSWLDCINLCVGSCTAVDFDQSRGDTCWHHTEDSSCQELSHKRGCTHYRIKPCIISAGNAPCE